MKFAQILVAYAVCLFISVPAQAEEFTVKVNIQESIMIGTMLRNKEGRMLAADVLVNPDGRDTLSIYVKNKRGSKDPRKWFSLTPINLGKSLGSDPKLKRAFTIGLFQTERDDGSWDAIVYYCHLQREVAYFQVRPAYKDKNGKMKTMKVVNMGRFSSKKRHHMLAEGCPVYVWR